MYPKMTTLKHNDYEGIVDRCSTTNHVREENNSKKDKNRRKKERISEKNIILYNEKIDLFNLNDRISDEKFTNEFKMLKNVINNIVSKFSRIIHLGYDYSFFKMFQSEDGEWHHADFYVKESDTAILYILKSDYDRLCNDYGEYNSIRIERCKKHFSHVLYIVSDGGKKYVDGLIMDLMKFK